ncbi:hypothetical protein B7494_g6393 [Chlorociboria aeruginascens]|nr:hypothetical protein B7494_g6393 [Chlorociboria aeruginascens]
MQYDGQHHAKSKGDTLRDMKNAATEKAKDILHIDGPRRNEQSEHNSVVKELDKSPAFDPSKFSNKSRIAPAKNTGNPIVVVLQGAIETIINPKASIKSRVTRKAAGKLAKSQANFSRQTDLDFLEAHDELDRARNANTQDGDAQTERKRGGDVVELKERIDELEKKRQSMMVAAVTSRHVQRVGIVDLTTLPPFPPDSFFEKRDDYGMIEFQWGKWIGYVSHNFTTQYIDDFEELPFNIVTLRRHVERLIVVSAPIQAFILDTRRIYRWEDPVRTGKCIMNYYYPTSIEELRHSIARTIYRGATALKLGELMDRHGSSDWLEPLIDELGPYIQVQIADLANFLEVLYNFYHFRSPRMTVASLCLFGTFFILSAFTSAEFSLKVFWFITGFTFFGGWPIASLYPRYRLLVSPFKWAFWDIPTHAEFSFQYLQHRCSIIREKLQDLSSGDEFIDGNEEISDTESYKSAESFHLPENHDILSFACTYLHTPGHLIISLSGIRFEARGRKIIPYTSFNEPYTALVEMSKRQTRSGILTLLAKVTTGMDELELKFRGKEGDGRKIDKNGNAVVLLENLSHDELRVMCLLSTETPGRQLMAALRVIRFHPLSNPSRPTSTSTPITQCTFYNTVYMAVFPLKTVPLTRSLYRRSLRQPIRKQPATTTSTPPSKPAPPLPEGEGTSIPVPNTIAHLPLWQRLGPLTRTFEAYGRSQRKRPYTTQFVSSLVIYFLGDLSAQNINGDEYDWKRTARALVISSGSSILSYKWFMFLGSNFNYVSKTLSLITKVTVNQIVFTPIFNTYFFGMQSLLSGDSFPEVMERIRRTVPISMLNSCKLWPAVTAFSFTFIDAQYRSLFAGVIAIGWQTYLSFLNRRAEIEEAESRMRECERENEMDIRKEDAQRFPILCAGILISAAPTNKPIGALIINSRLFKFTVGRTSDNGATEFFVHEEAIAQLSRPLHNLVRGDLSETQAGCTIWEDVSKETFERFVQFAYTGDYSVPQTEKRKGIVKQDTVEDDTAFPPQEVEGEPEVNYFGIENNNWGSLAISKKPKKKLWKDIRKSKRSPELVEEPAFCPMPTTSSPVIQPTREKYPETPLLSQFRGTFHSLSIPLLAPRNSYENTCEPAEDFERGQSYSNVFLAHASLYILGDYHLIDSLKALALHKLHKTLHIFQLNENVEDIIDLARLAYSNEGKGVEGGIGGLRDLVCRYMAVNASTLSLDAGFLDLLGEGGQFAQDLFSYGVSGVVLPINSSNFHYLSSLI